MCNANPISICTPVLSYTLVTALRSPYTLLTSTLPGVYVPVMFAAGAWAGNAGVAGLGTDCGAILTGP